MEPTPLDEVARTLDPAARRAFDGLREVHELAAEGCLRVPGDGEDLVVGFGAAHRACVLAAAQLVVPVHAARVARWLEALPMATDLGFKLSARPGDLQVYARGDLSGERLVDAFAAAEVACNPVVIRNGLLLFGRRDAQMAGLELRGDEAGGAVYTAVTRSRRLARALDDAVGFLAMALAADAADAWRALAPALVEAAGEEVAYVSFAPVELGGWVKLDVAERPLATARRVLDAMGLGDRWARLRDTIDRRGIQRWSHLGVRLGSPAPTVALYHSLLGER